MHKSENSTYNTSYMEMAVNKEILQMIVWNDKWQLSTKKDRFNDISNDFGDIQ